VSIFFNTNQVISLLYHMKNYIALCNLNVC